MSDVREQEPGLTDPAGSTSQSRGEKAGPEPTRRTSVPPSPDKDEDTRPVRAVHDPERTVLSSQRKRPAAPVTPPAGSRMTRRTARVSYPQRQASYTPPAVPYPPPTSMTPPPSYPARARASGWRWLFRSLVTASIFTVLLGLLGLFSGAIVYFWIAAQLPPAEELSSRSVKFATTQILDREGNLLWEIIDPTGGRRTNVTLEQVSPDLINATIATEDRFFYSNVGVDLIAIGRALYYNLTEGEIVSGASTITQQLARNVLLTPEERTEQTVLRKIKEAVLAVEINRRYSKKEILEIYLNQIYYGSLAYGIEAAAQTHFGKSAADLTLPEAAMLAGLPQSPALHDPYVNPAGAKVRQGTVLDLMVEAGYISRAEAEAAKVAELNFNELNFAFKAPHFVTYVRQELEKIIPPSLIYQAGLKVQTTLDPRLQALAEEEVQKQVELLAGQRANNGALVAIDVDTGQILAMVGSKNFRDDSIDGQVNMAIAPRQPGSTIKPLTYLATFEQLDWTPSTLLMDVPVEYANGGNDVYRPQNYDEKFHGPVSMRVALANSYNIPAIKALASVGVDTLKEMAARLGITTLTRGDYGLSLTLGSGEVPLLEMTGAYQAMANGGVLIPPTAILTITDNFGQVIEPARPQSRAVLRPEHAYLITNILADNEARSPSVGPDSFLRLSRPAAVKTGTTNDFRDNWTVGYTPDIVTGVWVGNADNTPMMDISGLAGAGPIWHNFMERAHEGMPVRDFTRPPAIVEMEVCADSGTIPSPACPERRKEIFFQEQPPLGPEHDIHQLLEIDLNTGLLANDFCQSNVEERYYRIYPPDGLEWALSQGIEQPPTEYCPSSNIMAAITNPIEGSTARGTLSLEGSAVAANFSHYQVELGVGTNPQAFLKVYGPVNQLVEEGVLGVFDTTKVENGPYTLRLVVFDRTGGAIEARVRVLVDNPIATVTPLPSPTEPIFVLPTPTATMTSIPSPTLPVPPTATNTPEPTATYTLEPTLPVELPDEPTFTVTVPPPVLSTPSTPAPDSIGPEVGASSTPTPAA